MAENTATITFPEIITRFISSGQTSAEELGARTGQTAATIRLLSKGLRPLPEDEDFLTKLGAAMGLDENGQSVLEASALAYIADYNQYLADEEAERRAEDIDSHVANSFREAREERAPLSQEGLADLAGVSRMSIVQIESGVHKPSIAMARAVAGALDAEHLVELTAELHLQRWQRKHQQATPISTAIFKSRYIRDISQGNYPQ